ncbi:peptidoglycan DD-metalloendopeptidase family protein [Rhodospirillaceae bacterium SYSU D60014]|uniref:M23 family metallopeptidase n=1 Tax=Virgifigura deserti TaxID=2268457 RepID=UPI000E674640
MKLAAPFRHWAVKSGVGLAVVGLASASWYTTSFIGSRVDAADFPPPSDLEQQLPPEHFVLLHSVPDSLLEDVHLGKAGRLVEEVVEVRSGDTLIGLLVDAGINRGEAYEAVTALEKVFAPRELKPGQELRLNLSTPGQTSEARERQLVEMSLQPDVERDVHVTRNDDGGFVAATIERPLTVEVAHASSSISSSLFEASLAQGVPLGAMAEIIRAFSYDVDFQREIHPGDRFEILYEEYRDEQGNLAKVGDVLFAALTLKDRELNIYRFTPSDDRADYFNPKGESIRKALLRTPIDGARISSGFGLRKHPILGYSRMHKGTDFAAPTGTPIFAAGDGVIARIGRNGGYGNYIQIRHNSEFSTAYAHTSRFAKGLKKGSRVEQGQVIAYVGTTGRSTGPHLHYEVLQNGKQTNPLSIKLPTGKILEGKDLQAFQAVKDDIDQLRKTLHQDRVLIARQPS